MIPVRIAESERPSSDGWAESVAKEESGRQFVTKVPGRLDRLAVDAGMSVREGDVIAELDRSEYRVSDHCSPTECSGRGTA